MNKSILITGISGTGKSAICDELIKRGYNAHSIEEINDLFAWHHKETKKKITERFKSNLENTLKHDWLCDIEKLKELMAKNSKGTVFYCGTGGNINDLIPYFDKTFLLVANEDNLRYRLSNRTSNDFARTSDVQDWVFSWKKWWEDQMVKLGAEVIDTNRDLVSVVDDIIKKSKSI